MKTYRGVASYKILVHTKLLIAAFHPAVVVHTYTALGALTTGIEKSDSSEDSLGVHFQICIKPSEEPMCYSKQYLTYTHTYTHTHTNVLYIHTYTPHSTLHTYIHIHTHLML